MAKKVPEATVEEALGWLKGQSASVLSGRASERHLVTGDRQDDDYTLFYDPTISVDGIIKRVDPQIVQVAMEKFRGELCGDYKGTPSARQPEGLFRIQILDFPVAGKQGVAIHEEVQVDRQGNMGRVDVSIIRSSRPQRNSLAGLRGIFGGR